MGDGRKSLNGVSMLAFLVLDFFNALGESLLFDFAVVLVEGRVFSLFEIHDSSE